MTDAGATGINIPGDDELRGRLEAACRATIELLGTSDDGRPAIAETEVELWTPMPTDTGAEIPVPTTETRPNASKSMQENWPELEELDEIRSLRTLLNPFEQQLTPNTKPTADPEVDRWVVLEAVGRILDGMYEGESLENQVETQVDLLSRTLQRGRKTAVMRAFLWNFDVNGVDNIELAGDVVLRRLSLSERQAYFRPIAPSKTEYKGHFERARWMLETTVDYNPDAPEYELVPRATFDTIVAIMRSLKDCNIGYQWVHCTYEFWQRSQEVRFEVRRHLFVPHGTCSFTPSEVEALRHRWETVHKQDRKHKSPLKVGISRLLDAEARPYPHDQLIDVTIALEAFLLPGVRDELRHRLGERGATLIDAPGQGPVELRSSLKNLYDARSRLVHGGYYGHPDFDVEDALRWAWSTLDAILQGLKYSSHRKILDRVDDYLLEAERETSLEAYLQDATDR